jgi:hypothetical protein
MAPVAGYRHFIRSIAGVVLLATAIVSSSNCLIAAEMIPDRTACPADAHRDGRMSIDQGCCTGFSSAAPASSPAEATAGVSAPPVALIGLLEQPVRLSLLTDGTWRSAVAIAKPPGSLTYLLLSTFRI